MQEIWKDIEESNNTVQVSNLGRFRRKACIRTDAQGRSYNVKEKILTPIKQNKNQNRLIITFYVDKKPVRYTAHRLVCKYFLKDYQEDVKFMPIDGDHSNLRADNWRLPTVRTKTTHFKLTDEDVEKIRKEYAETDFSMSDIARKYKVSLSYISRIIRNERKNKENK